MECHEENLQTMSLWVDSLSDVRIPIWISTTKGIGIDICNRGLKSINAFNLVKS